MTENGSVSDEKGPMSPTVSGTTAVTESTYDEEAACEKPGRGKMARNRSIRPALKYIPRLVESSSALASSGKDVCGSGTVCSQAVFDQELYVSTARLKVPQLCSDLPSGTIARGLPHGCKFPVQ